jgi:hypothetical protein
MKRRNLLFISVLVMLFAFPSMSQKGKKHDDSISISHSFGDDFLVVRDGANYILHKKTPLSVADFSLYQWYVRDSVTLEIVVMLNCEFYGRFESTKKYLNVSKATKKRIKRGEINSCQEIRNAGSLALNNKKLMNGIHDWNNRDWKFDAARVASTPVLVARAFRFYNSTQYVYNDQTLFYKYYENGQFNYHPIETNHWILSEVSQHRHDVFSVLAQVYPIVFRKSPVVGITDLHVSGFVKFMTNKLTRCLHQKGLHYKVAIENQWVSDTIHIEISRDSLLKNWEITKEDYKKFAFYLRDSSRIEFLYAHILSEDKAERFIAYSDSYFDEESLEWVDYDPAERDINRFYFPLVLSRFINLKDPEIAQLVQNHCDSIKKSGLQYLYLSANPINNIRSKIPEYSATPQKFNIAKSHIYHFDSITTYLPFYEDVDFSASQFPNLTYAQAIAFYNWKYPIRKVMNYTKSWEQYIFPSETEFEYLKRGELDKIRDIHITIPIESVQLKVKLTKL